MKLFLLIPQKMSMDTDIKFIKIAFPFGKAISLTLILRNNLFFVITSTVLAYSMGHHQLPAFAAFYQSWSSHFPVCSSFISSALGRFIFWTYRHGHTSLNLLKISWIAAILGSSSVFWHWHSARFRFAPHRLQMPLQSSLHRTFIGQLTKISPKIS